MKLKKILFTLASGCLALAGCTKTPTTPTKSKLVRDVIDYLESRNVTIDTIPYIEYIDDLKVLDTDTFAGDDEYVPYFYFLIEGDVVTPTLEAFKKVNWTVPETESEYGYECVDPTQKIEIDVFYSDKAEEGSGIGTNYYVYSYADLHSSYNGDGGNGTTELTTVADAMADFLLGRGVTLNIPAYFENVDIVDLVYSEVNEELDYYYPYYFFVLEGDVVNDVLAALKEDSWTVPNTASEYGYECVDADELAEIDVYYSDVDDAEEGSFAGTNCIVYAYDDLTGGDDGGDDGDDFDDPAAEAVALEIATSIFGADAAEENVGWFFAYYVMNTISGTDLRAAIQSETQHIPAGFTQEGEIAITTDTDEETGESYDIASVIFVNADGIVIDLEAAFSEEQGKIDIMYFVYSDDGDDLDDDELPGDQEGDANIIDNPDGSKTVIVDFSSFSDKATYSGQTIGELTITAIKGEGTNDTTYYKNGESLRIYWGTGLKFTVPQGKELLKVEFTCTTGNDKTVDVDNSNLTITGGSYTVNEKDVIITANQGVNELSMLINLKKGNVAITNISVTYK